MIPRARTRLLTVADDLSAIGGSEIAQLRVVEGLASAGWTVELQYVSRGDLWPRWNKVASSTQVVRASGLQRTAPLRSSLGVVEAVVGTMRSQAQVIYVHNPGDLPAALMAARRETDSRGRAPPLAATVSSAEMAELPHQKGGCRDHAVVRHGGTMGAGRTAV